MRDILLSLSHYADNFAVGVTVLAVLATLSSKILEQWFFLKAARKRRIQTVDGSGQGSADSGSPRLNDNKPWMTYDSARSSHGVARSHVLTRLEDARIARAKEQSSAKVSRILSGSLTFAQVVIGGVLASSFVQESLPQKTVGVFGVLVLIASLVKQQYHPEVDAEQARQRASRLEALIRLSEDELATIDARSAKGEDRTDGLIELRNQISRAITEIKNPEAAASRPPTGKDAPPRETQATLS
jgi:hypothetical protein